MAAGVFGFFIWVKVCGVTHFLEHSPLPSTGPFNAHSSPYNSPTYRLLSAEPQLTTPLLIFNY